MYRVVLAESHPWLACFPAVFFFLFSGTDECVQSRRCPVSKHWEKDENQYSDGTQVRETRGGARRGCQHRRIRRRRHVLFASPVSAQSINVPSPRLSILFPLVLFCARWRAPAAHYLSTSASLRLLSRPLLVSFAHAVRSSSHFVLITSHRRGVYGLSASLGIHDAAF